MKPPPDLAALPYRISTGQVLELAGYGRATLTKRIAEGRMPAAVDRGSGGLLYNRDAVLLALGLVDAPVAAEETDPWDFDPEELRKRLYRKPR